jgi:hypothetical protein
MDTSRKGKLLELYVLTKLYEKGYEVAIPFGTQEHWDILCYIKGGWRRIQVKTARMRGVQKDRVYVDFLRSKDRTENIKTKKWNYKGYSSKEIDLIIAVHPTLHLMWPIPIEDIEGKRSISFGINDYSFNF